MTRRYFRTFVSGEAKVSVGNGSRCGDMPFFGPDMLTKSTGNNEVDVLLYSLSGIVGNLDRKLNAIENKLYESEVGENRFYDCETIDISGNGIKILLREEITVGETLFISLDLFGYPNPRFEVYGKVVRLVAQPSLNGDMYYAGVEFLDLENTRREQVINFTFHQQRKYIRAFVDSYDERLEKTVR